jgi:hypothetical protein
VQHKNKTTKGWSKKKLLKFSFFSIIIFLLLLEAIFRIFFYIKYKGLDTSVYIQGSPLQEEDSLTIFNNRAYYVDYEKKFQYNALGMKSACGDYKMPVKKEGDLWILLLGGSAIEGMGSNKDGKWLDITNITDHPYNETITYYLQGYLKDQNPGKNIRVFNGAVSGFNIHQSFAKYKFLSKNYDFDWVISMDGVNEPDTLQGNEQEFEKDKRYWSSLPFKQFPLKYIIPITQHSALLNTIKQQLYYFRLNRRMNRNRYKDFPDRKFWASQPKQVASFIRDDPRVTRAVNSFVNEIHNFATQLKQDNKKYLFLIQPYLIFRDSTKRTSEETALYNYLLKEYNDKYKFSFMKNVYDTIDRISRNDLHIQTMSVMNEWDGWTLVDYCHFTKKASERIGMEIGRFINADTTITIFVKNK